MSIGSIHEVIYVLTDVGVAILDTNAKQREDLPQQSIAVRCAMRTLRKIEI